MEKSKLIEKLFYYIVTCSYLLIPLAFLIFRAKKKDVIPVILCAYALVCFVSLVSHEYLPRGTARKIYQAVYTYTEYLFLAVIFWYTLKNKTIKKLILLLSAGFFIFQILHFRSSSLVRLDSVPIGIETILIFFYIVYFFYEFSKSLNAQYIYNHYCFWIAVGVLIYLGGSFFFYLSINQLNPDEVEKFGNMTYLAEIIKNVMFGLAVFIYTKHPIVSTNKKTNSVPFLDMI